MRYPPTIFAIAVVLLAGACAFDLWLLVLLRDAMETNPATELNPIGRLLILAGGVPLFAAVKCFAASLTLAEIVALRSQAQRLVDSAVSFVALLYWALLAWMLT